jgi:ferredoxin
MQVSIDESKCQGHGRCVLIAPGVFDVDDDGLGIVTVTEVPDGLEASVHNAVASCPESAITVT